jgi:hypothetical protein
MDNKTEATLVESIAKIASALNDERTTQIPFHKAKIPTPFNPSGDRNRPKLTRPVWFNGALINPVFLTNEEIELCNQLKPGRYHGRQWQVIERTNDPDRPLEIRVQDASVEDRMSLYKDAPSFAALCKAMIAEQGTIAVAR